MMKWMSIRGIKVFRLPSDMIPHGSNQKLIELCGERGKEYLQLDFCKEALKKLGEIAKELKIRCTFHPGQYNQLGSKDKKVITSTYYELNMHCKILDLMDVDKDGVMVIHGGGTYGNIDETIERIIKMIKLLPERIKRRLVLENCEKCYSPDLLLRICEETNTPLVFDIHHYICYEMTHPKEQTPICDILPRILETWRKREIRPKFHISEQDLDKRLGAHSFFIENIQECLLEIPEKYKIEIDLMIEAKGKELAIGRLYQKYPHLAVNPERSIEIKLPKKALKDFGKYKDCCCD